MLDRNAIFKENLAWAALIALKVHRTLPPSFDLCDLEQVARIEHWKRCGLDPNHKGAVYDPEKNNNYRGYAYVWIFNAVRMAVRRKNWKASTGEELDEKLMDGRALPLEVIQQREEEKSRRRSQLRLLIQLIKALPVEQAYLVRRVYLNEVEPEAVAQCWGVSRAQVSRQLTSAIRALRKAAKDPAPVKPQCKGGWLFLGSGKVVAV